MNRMVYEWNVVDKIVGIVVSLAGLNSRIVVD